MEWQYTPYIVPLILAAAISIGLAAFAWYHRAAPGARPLAVLMAAVAEWSLVYALSLIYVELPAQLFWTNAMYVGIVIVTAAWLVFALDYIGHKQWLTRRNLALLAIVPAITLLTIWTDDVHQLFRREVYQVSIGEVVLLDATMGPAFWVHTAYSYLLLSIGTWLLAREIIRAPHLYRGQAVSVLIGAFLPWGGNVLYLMGANPVPQLDLTPFMFTLTSIVLSWGLFRFRLLDIVPVARDTVIESMDDGVIVLDAQNRIVDMNPAACRIIGRTQREAIGQPARSMFVHYVDVVARYRDVLTAHTNIVLNNGPTERTFDMRISPLHDRAGHPTGRIIVLHDITELTRTTQELHQAKDAAEAANRAKTAFIRNMSHELRTPLTAMMGYNDLIQQELLALGLNSLAADTERIRVAGTQLLTLISNLIDISHIEAGKSQLAPETFRVATLLDEIVATFQTQVAHKGNALQLVCEGDLGEMHTDRLRLQQVLQNLLSNAAKFTTQGQIILSARRETVNQAAWIEFRVTDTGIGIHAAQMQRIFQVFTQADDTIAQKYGGTGLGLALSQRLCELLGGTIRAESEVGLGSTFIVQLPAVLAAPAGQTIET